VLTRIWRHLLGEPKADPPLKVRTLEEFVIAMQEELLNSEVRGDLQGKLYVEDMASIAQTPSLDFADSVLTDKFLAEVFFFA